MHRSYALILLLVAGLAIFVLVILKNVLLPRRADALPSLIKGGSIQAAIRTAKRIIAKNPRDAEAHYYLGVAYHQDKQDELALAELKTVLSLGISGKDIPELEFRDLLARLFASRNENEEALKEFLLLIKLMPTHADYYYQAGKLFHARNGNDKAVDYLRKAAELSPRDGRIHFELGLMLYRERNAAEAKAELSAALRYPGENPEQVHFYLGKIQKDAKDYAAAASSFAKAARGEYRVRALVERGGCFMAQGDVAKATADLKQAAAAITDETSPESLYARYFLGNCYESSQEIEKAIAQWDMVYAIKKNFKDVGEKLLRYQHYQADDGPPQAARFT